MTGAELLERVSSREPLWVLRDARLDFLSTEDVERELTVARQHAAEIASKLVPAQALTCLVDAATRYYYGGSYKDDAPQLGTGLKVAIAELWPRLWMAPGGSTEEGNLDKFVGWATFIDFLISLRSAFFVATGGRVEVTAQKYLADGPVGECITAMKISAVRRGESLRLAKETTRLFLRDVDRTVLGILKVERGLAPCETEELSGTWLHKLHTNEPMPFWTGLLSRILVLVFLSRRALETGQSPDGVIEFSDGTVGINAGLGGGATNATMTRDMFWQRDWLYQVRDVERLPNLLVERPLLRISWGPAKYISSLALVGDAINWFVEASVFGQPGGVALSKRAFRAILSEPFELKVAATLRSLGFQAGKVNDKGIWFLPDKLVDLRQSTGSQPPGEIDVLAVHDQLGLLMIECKILAAPANRMALRNMMGKLGRDDHEAIRSKVLRKLAWCKRSPLFHQTRSGDDTAMIVLDHPWPGIVVGPDVSVVTLETLEEAVRELLPSNRGDPRG